MEASGNLLVESLERVIRAQGRLLRVQRVPLPGPVGARASSALRFIFDVGVLTLRPDEAGSGVEVGLEAGAGSEDFVSASEDDPWWTVMGNRLTGVQPRSQGGVLVQFRGDEENPRRLTIFTRSGGVEASLHL